MSNAVLLLSDEHNPFISSVHGHEYVRTPNMARIAGAGTVFENAYCPSPLCLPSRSALMSGRRVHELQTYSNCNTNLREDYLSWGAELKRQGVHSAYVGKVDTYADGEKLGFSDMILPGNRKPHGDPLIRRRPLFIREGAEKRADGFGPHENPYHADVRHMDAALEWLNTKAPEIEEPWVLAINLHAPHFPHWVTQELWDMYPDGGDLPAFGADCETARHPYAADLREHFRTELFTEEQIRGLRRGYLGCVTYVDTQIGRVLDTLAALGLTETTNFLYSSDHGEMLGKFGMWWKCTLFEDSVHIPMMACGPDFTPGRRVRTAVDSHDLQAALFHAAGAERPSDWVGTPLQEIPDDDAKRPVFSEYHGHGTRAGAYMIRKGDWKLIHYTEAPDQLFNLADDPDELKNLHDDEPRKTAELMDELRVVCSPEEEDRRAFAFQEEQLAVIGAKWKNAPHT